MGTMFFWMQDPVDSLIKQNTWTTFLDFVGMVSAIVGVITITVIVTLYAVSARRRKIHDAADLFAPYTPMYWLMLALIAAVVVGGVCAYYYHSDLDPEMGQTVDGLFLVSAYVALWTGAWSAVLSFLLIAFTPFTPPKFKYRPVWWLYRSKGVRAGL